MNSSPGSAMEPRAIRLPEGPLEEPSARAVRNRTDRVERHKAEAETEVNRLTHRIAVLLAAVVFVLLVLRIDVADLALSTTHPALFGARDFTDFAPRRTSGSPSFDRALTVLPKESGGPRLAKRRPPSSDTDIDEHYLLRPRFRQESLFPYVQRCNFYTA